MRNIVFVCWRYSFAPPWKPFCCLFPSQLSDLVVQNFRCYKRPWLFLHPCPIFYFFQRLVSQLQPVPAAEKREKIKYLERTKKQPKALDRVLASL